jgi:CheY-like chemotaxis protein
MPVPVPPSFRILIAEDQPVNRRLTERMLARLGCAYDVAENGFQVLDALRHADYEIILMDLDMPGMDGIEATRRIRADPAYARTPRIVAVTARQGDKARVLCLASGLNEFLSKPVSVDDLQRVIEGRPTPHTRDRSTALFQRLQELRDLGGDAFVDDLNQLFFAESDARVGELDEAFRQGDLTTAGRTFHQLQGSAANIGAFELHAICGIGDEACTQGERELAEGCHRLVVEEVVSLRDLLGVEKK